MKKLLIRFISLFIIITNFNIINVSAVTYRESEDNNSYATANTIVAGNTMRGVISKNDDKDYYKITSSSDGKVGLKFKHNYKNSDRAWNIYEYVYEDGQYNELACVKISLDANEEIELPFIGVKANGIYYLKVECEYCYDNIDGTIGKEYTLETSFASSGYYEKELNETYQSATKITLGNNYIGTINKANDKDYYKITSLSDGKVGLKFKHNYKNSSRAWNIYEYVYEDGQYNELACVEISLKANEEIELPFIGVKANGIYYLKVECEYWKDDIDGTIGKEYTLETSFASSGYYEKELNETYQSATKITLGNNYIGTINKADDKDYYKITSLSDGKVGLKFKHNYKNSTKAWKIYEYMYEDGQYNELACVEISLDANEEIELPFIGVKANGIYYLKVECESWNNNLDGTIGKEYTLETSFASSGYYEKETNNEYSTATTVEANKKYTGVISNSGDQDFYKFIPKINGAMTFNFSHTMKNQRGEWLVTLYEYLNGSYKELEGHYICIDDKTSYDFKKYTVKKGGIYYVKVEDQLNRGSTGYNYSLTFKHTCTSHDALTTDVILATLSENGLVIKSCSTCGYYSKTTLYSPKTFKLSTTSYTYDGKEKKPSVSVLDSNGKTISSSNYTVSYASGRKNVGSYKVTVKGKGNYSFTKTLTFKINPPKASVSSLTKAAKAFTAKWSKKSTQVTGYEIQYSTSSKFTSGNKTVTVSSYNTTSKKISGLKAKKKYYVRIRTYKTVSGTKYYSSWSSSKNVTTK